MVLNLSSQLYKLSFFDITWYYIIQLVQIFNW